MTPSPAETVELLMNADVWSWIRLLASAPEPENETPAKVPPPTATLAA